MFQQLESVIEQHYSLMSKSDVLECSQEFCNHFMIQTNSMLQTNLNIWDDNKVRDYSNRVLYYADINAAILTLQTGVNDQGLTTKGKDRAYKVFEMIKKEFEFQFLSSDNEQQKKITDEIYLPHLSFLWLFKNY